MPVPLPTHRCPRATPAPSSNSGFTLTEIVVVMVILAVLMAIAIPSYRSHKRNSIASKAKTQVRATADAIESCAAGEIITSYRACDQARITSQEPDLADDFDGSSSGGGGISGDGGGADPEHAIPKAPGCDPPMGTVCISRLSARSYQVVARVGEGAGGDTMFVLTKSALDGVEKTCTSAGTDPAATTALCPQDTW